MTGRSKRSLLAMVVLSLSGISALAVLAVRIVSVAGAAGALLPTTGGEPITIYNIMKAQRGLTLYEDPREPPFYPTTLYNAGFYRTYAVATRAFSNDVTHLVLAIRVMTLALACVGLACLLTYGLADLNRRSPASSSSPVALVTVLVAAATVFGSVTGWWLLSARPDVGAAAFGAVALAIVLGSARKKEWAAGLGAGACLALAWTFKQSCVFIFLGLVTAAMIQKRYRLLIGLAIPVLAVVIALPGLLSPQYRYNAFVATSFSGFDPRNLAHLAVQLAVKGAFPLTAAIIAIAALPRIPWLRADERITLSTCWWICLIFSMLTCCRNGSDMNYFFELWSVVGFLAVIAARWLIVDYRPTAGRPPLLMLVLVVASLFSAGLDAARLALPNHLGIVRLSVTAEQAAELERARALALNAGGPVYCQPALEGLAWDLPLPRCFFDDYKYFHQPALARGVLHGAGWEGLLAQRYFSLLILRPDDEFYQNSALSSGYVRQAGWKHLAVLEPPPKEIGMRFRAVQQRSAQRTPRDPRIIDVTSSFGD
jgi:hypothetical protein